MGVRPGYKLTDMGAIPQEWDFKRLGDLASVSAGGTPSRAVARYWNGEIPWVTTAEVDFDTITHAEQSISKEGLNNSAAKLLPTGTLLMALYGQGKTRGKIGILGIEAATNQACAAISLDRGVLAEFIFYYLASQYESIRKLSNTGNQENLNGALVRSIPVLLPPPQEQGVITKALSDVDALLGALDRLIAKKRDLKQAAMQQLLTGQTRLPGFHGEWEVKQLGDVGVFTKGSGIKKNEVVADGLPCVRYGEIYTHHNDHVRAFNSFITPGSAKRSQRLEKGDLLFAGSGETAEEIGKCVAFLGDQEAYAGGDIVILRPGGQSSEYLGYLLNHSSIAAQKARMGQGDAVVHISARNLAQLELRLPALAEQTAIAEVLSDLDAELTALERRRDKTHDLKQGMMQELLTGKVRLA